VRVGEGRIGERGLALLAAGRGGEGGLVPLGVAREKGRENWCY